MCISFSIIVLLVLWSISIEKALSSSRFVTCSIARTFGNLINGQSSENSVNPGLGGALWFVSNFRNEAFAIAQKNGFKALDGLEFKNKADSLGQDLTKFYQKYYNKKVSSCSGGNQVIPGIIGNLTSSINNRIGDEYEFLRMQIHSLDKTIKLLKSMDVVGTVSKMENNLEANISMIRKDNYEIYKPFFSDLIKGNRHSGLLRHETSDKKLQNKTLTDLKNTKKDSKNNSIDNVRNYTGIDKLLKKLEAEIKVWMKNLSTARKWTFDVFPYDQYYIKLNSILFIVTISFIALVSTNLFLIYLTIYMKNCRFFSCVAKSLIPTKCCCGGLISILYIYFMLASIVTTNGCFFFQKSMDDPNLMKAIASEELFKIADSCVYKNSSGIFLSLVDKNSTEILDVQFFQSLSGLPILMNPSLIEIRSNGLKALDYYKDSTLSSLQNFSNLDYLPGKASFALNLDKFNKMVHKIAPSDLYTFSQTFCNNKKSFNIKKDKPNSHLGEPYCIVLPDYPFSNITARYQRNPELDTPYSNLKECTSSYRKLIENMRGTLGIQAVQNKDKLFELIKKSSPTLESFNKGFNESMTFLKDLGNDVGKTFDCRILRNELEILGNTVCHKEMGFATKMMHQTHILFYMGLLMSLLGCCQFFQMRIVHVYNPKAVSFLSIGDELTNRHFMADESFDEGDDEELDEESVTQSESSVSIVSISRTKSFIFDNELSFQRLKIELDEDNPLDQSDRSGSTTANEK